MTKNTYLNNKMMKHLLFAAIILLAVAACKKQSGPLTGYTGTAQALWAGTYVEGNGNKAIVNATNDSIGTIQVTSWTSGSQLVMLDSVYFALPLTSSISTVQSGISATGITGLAQLSKSDSNVVGTAVNGNWNKPNLFVQWTTTNGASYYFAGLKQ